MASMVKRLPTAFSNAPASGKKRPREKDGKHLDFIRGLPCVITGKRPVEAAHIRMGDPAYAKRETGMGERPSDCWVLPLHADLHREQHAGSERLFWARHGLDPMRIALALHHNTGDDEQAAVILREAWNAVASFKSPVWTPQGGNERDRD